MSVSVERIPVKRHLFQQCIPTCELSESSSVRCSAGLNSTITYAESVYFAAIADVLCLAVVSASGHNHGPSCVRIIVLFLSMPTPPMIPHNIVYLVIILSVFSVKENIPQSTLLLPIIVAA